MLVLKKSSAPWEPERMEIRTWTDTFVVRYGGMGPCLVLSWEMLMALSRAGGTTSDMVLTGLILVVLGGVLFSESENAVDSLETSVRLEVFDYVSTERENPSLKVQLRKPSSSLLLQLSEK